ncbi:hypothetical protein [Bradyrhizobium japonicum]|uniref:hypothetical protein n=1 Tax=Bradyrhizobium japonicum TaxID=375 RepID=UPI00200E6376|nr:hypothetical protein [Bradyrhizobium japonicum]UQE03631.1 hypothetical protein JEY30_47755 [Bradyrhizobium japonicum]
MAGPQSSGVIDLAAKDAHKTLASAVVHVSKAGSSGRLALKGTADQLKSALTVLGSTNQISAVVTLRGGTPAGQP